MSGQKANFALAQSYAAMETISRATTMSLIALEMNRAMGNSMSCEEHNKHMSDLSDAMVKAIENLALIEVTNEWVAENSPEFAQIMEDTCQHARRACNMAMSTSVHFGCIHLSCMEHGISDEDKIKLGSGYQKLIQKLRTVPHSDVFQDPKERQILGTSLDVISFDMLRSETIPAPHQLEFDHEVYDLMKLRARSYMRKTVRGMLNKYNGEGPMAF